MLAAAGSHPKLVGELLQKRAWEARLEEPGGSQKRSFRDPAGGSKSKGQRMSLRQMSFHVSGEWGHSLFGSCIQLSFFFRPAFC